MSHVSDAVPILQDGLDSVVSSLGSLVQTSFRLAETTAGVMERELALAIQLSQRVRDQVVSAETLASARKRQLPARFREDAHAVVDLVADAGAVLFHSAVIFVDGLVGRTQTHHSILVPPTV
ncbi:MAG: hypothetical protein WB992_22000 [Bryobacteraceae bacterium]